jgi:hypothetical protein
MRKIPTVFLKGKHRPILRYAIEYSTRPYGKKNPIMIGSFSIFSESKKDAKEWAKILAKDKENWNIKIHKLKKVI